MRAIASHSTATSALEKKVRSAVREIGYQSTAFAAEYP